VRVFTTAVVLFVLSYSQAAFAQEVTACEARAIPTLGGTHVHANDLNERGRVVGRSSLPNDANVDQR